MSKSLGARFSPTALVIGALSLLLAGQAQAQGQLAQMSTPAPGSTFSATTVTFTWTAGTGIGQYWLYVGNSKGGFDLFSSSETGLTDTVTGLPNDGRTLYVRLWSLVTNAVSDVAGWNYIDYTYTAFNSNSTCTTPTAAQLSSPNPGSVLPGSSVTFQWGGGSCITSYTLSVGKAVGGADYFGPTQLSIVSLAVSTLPTDGSTVYVRLTSNFNNSTSQSVDYTFTAFNSSGGCSQPVGGAVTSPSPGATLTGSSQVFTWSAGCGVAAYYLYVGSAIGGNDIFGQNLGASLTANVTNLPTDGRTLYVRLWSFYSGLWHYIDYTYTAAGSGGGCGTPAPAGIISPANGATLAGATQTFSWTAGACVTAYTLQIGNSVGASDIYGPVTGAALTQTATNLPADGRTLYVRLTSTINGSPQSIDYQYTAFNSNGSCGAAAAATILSPTPASTLSGSSVTFTWSAGCGVTDYYLYVGTVAGGNDIYGKDQMTSLSVTVTNLPTNGLPVYVRLWSQINSVYHFIDYTYTAAGAGACSSPTPAMMISPTPSSTLTGSSAVFTWSAGTCVTSYTISVGNEVGGAEIFTSSGTATTATVSNLPTAGQTIYVRLSSVINSVVQSIDYTYTAFSVNGGCGSASPANMISPTPGSTLPGPTVAFAWTKGCSAVQYYLYVGTAPGGNDLYGQSQGTNQTVTVTNLPTSGITIYVRLWSQLGTSVTDVSNTWQYIDYTYTSSSGGQGGCTTPAAATIATPTPGSTFPGASVVFTWNAGSCVTSYTLSVGTSVGASDIFQSTPGVVLAAAVTNLPTNGITVYVRLTSVINGSPTNNDYTYTAANITACSTVGIAATMQSPTPNSTLTGSTVTFTWNAGCNVSQYFLWVGTTPGGSDIYDQNQGQGLSTTVSNIPTNGQPVYVRLWSLFQGAVIDVTVGWNYVDYTYTASSH